MVIVTPVFFLAFLLGSARNGGMLDADRFKLLFGPYAMPRCRVGRWRKCVLQGKVKVVGISDTPIPWPQCRSNRHLVPIICGGLLKAIKRESNQAVAWHWGVCAYTVSKWRKALGVRRSNEGTHELQSAWMPERLDDEARERQRQSLKSPERGAKIGAAQGDRKRSPETIAKMRKAKTGFRHTKKTRAKMRTAQLERYAREPNWTQEEDALLATKPDHVLAKLLDRHRDTIRKRRLKLGVSSFRKHGPFTPSRKWTAADDALLGTMIDPELAMQLCRISRTVYNRRDEAVMSDSIFSRCK
jgi:hypothetical protein